MSLIPGTVVTIDYGFYKHVGLITDRTMNGMPMIISNSFRKGGVFEESWEEFSCGKKTKISGYPGSLFPHEVLSRARSKIGAGWNLLTWNCEHFVNWSHGMKTRSPQLNTYAACTISIIGLAVLLKNNKLRIIK